MRDIAVCNRAARGLHLRDDPRQSLIAGLTQMHLVADPGRTALAGIVGIGVIGRTDEPCRRRDAIPLGTPEHMVVRQIELLDPNLTQHLSSRQMTEPLW